MAKMQKNKVLFVISALAGGGAERVLVLLLKHLDRSRFKPVLVIFNDEKAYSEDFYRDVPIVCLNKRNRFDFFRLIWRLSRLIRKERPDLILSFLNYTNYLTILAHGLASLKSPIILNERNNLTHSLVDQKFYKIKKLLVSKLYPRSNRIICVSKGVREDLITNHEIPKDKCLVIYNGTELERIRELGKEEVDCSWFKKDIPTIVSCGRLTAQKNYPLLLEAISLVLKSDIKVKLIILGDGEDRSELETLAKDLGISHNVMFLGFQGNPFKYISRATVFVLSSLWEGFPNVLIEAMACGVPVISTRCPYGPDEMITDKVNGLLVPPGDLEALAGAILRLLKDQQLRNRLAGEGIKKAEDFRIEKIVAEYEEFFQRTIRETEF